MRIRIFFVTAILLFLLFPQSAMAIPAFSKKYEAPCILCHTSWPRLNSVGDQFKINGYQMPKSEDGGTIDKLSPASNLFLDYGLANPPVSVRLEGGATVTQPSDGPENKQSDKYLCCIDGASVSAQIGGSIGKNVGYWVSLPFGKDNVEQAYMRFVSFMGPGTLNVDFGAMRVIDYDAVSIGREWFTSPLVAFYGNPYVSNARNIGMGAAHNDTGLRFYGRPDFGDFSYEVGIYTGSQIIGDAEDDSKFAYTLMGRADFNKLAVSFRYWKNETGALDQTAVNASGETLKFLADINKTDEKTEEFIISALYRHPRFEVDFTLDMTALQIGDRAATGSDGVEHTFSQADMKRTGVALTAIWNVNSWFETGIGYGFSLIDSFERTVDGVTTSIDSMNSGMVQWRLGIMPVMNMKVGMEIQVDMSDTAARTKAGGETYPPQNKVLLHWDMSI